MPDSTPRPGRTLTFRHQLVLAFGALLAILLVAAVVMLGRFGGVEDARRHIDGRTTPYATALSAAAVDMKAMANDERGFLMTGDAKFRDEIAERTEKIREELGDGRQGRPRRADRRARAEHRAQVRRVGGRAREGVRPLRDRPGRPRSSSRSARTATCARTTRRTSRPRRPPPTRRCTPRSTRSRPTSAARAPR